MNSDNTCYPAGTAEACECDTCIDYRKVVESFTWSDTDKVLTVKLEVNLI